MPRTLRPQARRSLGPKQFFGQILDFCCPSLRRDGDHDEVKEEVVEEIEEAPCSGCAPEFDATLSLFCLACLGRGGHERWLVSS